MKIRSFCRLALMFLVMMLYGAQVMAANGWDQYKCQYMTADGRIRDTSNNDVSHTEGQGFAMLLAVFYDDHSTFDRLWRWTETHLANTENGLFFWRYDPKAAQPVTDKNNASDGDTLIAWALLRAGNKWHDAAYLKQSEAIQRAIVTHNVVTFADRTLLLPGVQGFNKNSRVVVNPSYFLFPAWAEFAVYSHLKVWSKLTSDGQALLSSMRFGRQQLPLDWVAVHRDGSMTPALGWPPRFSFDAIRIPLYLWWANPQSPYLATYRHLWQATPRLQTPAWLDVMNNSPAPYNLAGGGLAVRDLTLGDTGMLTDTLNPSQDYYSASLQLLSWMAWQEKR